MGLFLRHPLSLEHDTGPHPESPARIRAIEARLEAEDWHGLELLEAPAAAISHLERVHSPRHISSVEGICASGGGRIDLDTVASPRSYDAALRAAGAAAHAAAELVSGRERVAVCALRPPGHHAERDEAMGFCLFNNVAVAAAEAIEGQGAERVMILDWDVHHGNGTQEIFYSDDRVLFTSIHQMPLYPGSGAPDETGSGAGEGYTVNLPVPPGAGPAEFVALVQHVVAPIARSFRPDLFAISAGFDAHRDDPLAECVLDAAAYGAMAAAIRELAAELGIGILVTLEGGYALGALADSLSATIAALTGSGPAPQAHPEAAEPHLSRLADRWSLAR